MSIDNFTNKAKAYAKGQPGYPRQAVDKIMDFASRTTVFADIGAGTGKLTLELAKWGHRIYAVEPNEDMRSQLRPALIDYPNIKIKRGRAEATFLSYQEVDIITVAHALHYFHLDYFRRECQRIMKPDGWIMALYNHVPGKESDDFGRKAVDAFFSKPEIWTFDNPIRYTKEDWLAYIASQDDSPLPGDPEYDKHIDALNETFERDSVDGLMHCDRITKLYIQKADTFINQN